MSKAIEKGIYDRGSSLHVITRKRIKNSKQPLILTTPIKKADYDSIEQALAEARKVKTKQLQEISSFGFDNSDKKKVRVHGLLGETIEKVSKEKEKENTSSGHEIFAKDVLTYFPSSIKLKDMQTVTHYDNFVAKMKDIILNREANNLGSVNTRTINKRLGFLRDIFRYGMKERSLDRFDLLDPEKAHGHMGWKNLKVIQSQQKNVITPETEQQIVDEAIFDGETEFVDAFRWLLNGYGMRIEFEFQKLTIDAIKFPRGKDRSFTISFLRNKTNTWAKDLPMNKITQEIALRYREKAMKRTDRKLFPNMTKRKLRTLFEKYTKRLGLVGQNKITPYCTKHTFVTRLAENGVPVKTISKLAGITIETALNYYNQTTDEGMIKAMQTLEDDSSKVVPMYGHNRKLKV